MMVVVPTRTIIAIMTIIATEESAPLIPEVLLMILGHILMTIIWLTVMIVVLRRLGWMRVNVGLIVLCVLLLPHILGGPLVTVVAMMPIICLVVAIGSLDHPHLGGCMTILMIVLLLVKFQL